MPASAAGPASSAGSTAPSSCPQGRGCFADWFPVASLDRRPRLPSRRITGVLGGYNFTDRWGFPGVSSWCCVTGLRSGYDHWRVPFHWPPRRVQPHRRVQLHQSAQQVPHHRRVPLHRRPWWALPHRRVLFTSVLGWYRINGDLGRYTMARMPTPYHRYQTPIDGETAISLNAEW